MSDLEHLHPSTRLLLDLSDAERKQKARTKRWIPYHLARHGYSRMQTLLDAPRQSRPENLLVVAPTGNGKSMLLERFRDDHLPCQNPEGDAFVVPVLHLIVPDEPSVDALLLLILDKLFAPVNPRMTRIRLRREAFAVLKAVQTKLILVDETHNLMLAGQMERLKLLAFLRALGNEPGLHASVVCAGTEKARRAVQSDLELLNRFDIHTLPIWRDGERFRELLASFESLLPLRKPSYLAEDEGIAQTVLSQSDGLIGEMFKIISRAAVLAIDSGEERITPAILSKIDYRSPTSKRVAIEDVAP